MLDLAKRCKHLYYYGVHRKAPVRLRRRGSELEADLLESAWCELSAVGFPNLTMESVAARAQTGIAVLYRRWANKGELVVAAISYRQTNHSVDLPDTGTLRGDLLAALTGMGIVHADYFLTVFSVSRSGLLSDTGLTPKQLRDRIIDRERLRQVHNIFERAHARGEIDLARTSQNILDLPFDLVRHDLLMYPQPLKTARIKFILDDVAMPLLQVSANRVMKHGKAPRDKRRRV